MAVHQSATLLTDIGLILLLFIIGLEIDLRQLMLMGKTMFVLGFTQFFACVVMGAAFFRVLGYSMGGGNFDLLYLAVAPSVLAGDYLFRLLKA